MGILLSGCICTELLVLLATLLGALAFYFKYKFGFWKRLGVPYLKPTFPFGNMGDLFMQRKSVGGTLNDIYNQLKKRNLKFGGMYFFSRPMFIPIDPDIVKSIIQTDFDHFVDRGIYMNERGDPVTAHIFLLRGTRWRNLRTKITPTFTSGKMKFMFTTLVDCSAGLAPLVDQSLGKPIDIKNIVSRYTTDVIGSCAFGIDCNTLKTPDNSFSYYGQKLFQFNIFQAFKFFCSFAFPNLMLKLNATILDTEVTGFFKGVVQETVEYREKHNVQRKDFMNLLIQLKNQGKVEEDDAEETSEKKKDVDYDDVAGPGLSLNEIAANCFVFYVAGFETSSSTLSFCLFELTQNMDVQEKLRQEIRDVLEKHGGNITYDALMDMHYMENIIQETLRLYPPVPMLNRVCNKAYKIPGTDITLPVGTHVFIVNHAMQCDSEHFPNPTVFDPNRFTDEIKNTRHLYAHLPFGEGPRHCIGLRFGMMQIKVALAVLLTKFKFALHEKTQLPLKMSNNVLLNSVEGSIWLDAERLQ